VNEKQVIMDRRKDESTKALLKHIAQLDAKMNSHQDLNKQS